MIRFVVDTSKAKVNSQKIAASAVRMINCGSSPSLSNECVDFMMKVSTVEKTKTVKTDDAKQKFMKNLWFLAPTHCPIPEK